VKTPQQIIYDSTDWKALEKQLSKMDSGPRGKVFEWFCVFYLQVESRHATTYKEVLHSDQFLKQTKIKKILGFTKNKEEGVDAIGIRHDGMIDIIQCKYLDRTDKNLTKTHVESSLDIANGKTAKPYVDTILMCSNAKGLTKNEDLRKRHPNIQFRTLLYGDYKHLKKDDFDKIRAVIEGAIPEHEPKNPRSYQEATKNKIIEHFKKESRGLIVHACGTGKTLTSYFTYRELKPKITLFAVPSLQLLNQSLLEWTRESLADNNPISPFAVCSDKSNEKLGECEPELWLQEMGIRVSNKKEDLDIFLKSRRKNKVIFATYQSGDVLAKNIKALNKQIDFAFFDEAHNTATGKGKLSSHLLNDKNIPIKKRLFMTATPKVFKGDSDTEIASMDSEELYGKLIDEITVKDAINGINKFKLLNDYKIVTQIIDNEQYKALLEDNPFVIDEDSLPKEAELKLLASAITLKKIREEKNIKNTVSFHSFRKRARAFERGAKIIDKELNTYYVDGTQSGTERLNILDDFASNSPSLVTNAQCLSEGVNVPSIDAILFVDPKQSRIAITQAIGRALRKGDSNKGMSYIIVPTIVDVDDPENNDKRYENILTVLTAMAHHDGRIIEYFTALQEGKKPPKQFLEINSEYSTEKLNLKEFEKELTFKAWNRLRHLSWRPFSEAREHARSLGLQTIDDWHKYKLTKEAPADIPHYPNNCNAYKGEWKNWQDFLNIPTAKETLETFIKEYKLYAKGKSIPVPSSNYVTESGFELGKQMNTYLAQHNQSNNLAEWKINIINKELVAPNLFSWKGKTSLIWFLKFNAYSEYIEKYKTTPKRNTKYKSFNISEWADTQKKRYQKKIGNKNDRQVSELTDRELSLLKGIGFTFDNLKEKQWKNIYIGVARLLNKHKGKIPTLDPKTNKKYKYNDVVINNWIAKQREKYNNPNNSRGTLTHDQFELLDKLKYWSWDPADDDFNLKFNRLMEYIIKTEDANPKTETVYMDIKIGLFLGQCRRGRQELFKPTHRKKLEKLGTNFKPTRKVGAVNYYD